jgi:anthranilate 1,2-dioxygenase ferredoxin subunit
MVLAARAALRINGAMTWTTLARLSDLTNATRMTAGAVTLIRDQDRWHAIASRCPHMGYPMEKATLRAGVVTCAWHRWEFDLTSGGCYRGACADLPVYPLRIVDGQVQVALDAVTAQASAAAVARLRDRLLEGDSYQIARSIAECLELGLTPREVALPIAHHGFSHAIAAHRSSQATAELIEVVEGARISEQFPSRERILPLLHGSAMVGSGVGERPAVVGLPGVGNLEHRRAMLHRYIDDPSALAIERLLCDWPADDRELDATLLAAAAEPKFLPSPGVMIDVVDALELVSWLGADYARQRAPLVAWILGQRRGDPAAEERLAISWLEAHQDEITRPPTSQPGAGLDIDLLLPVYAANSPEDAFAHVWGLMSRVGFSPLAIIDGFSQIEARRLAKLRPNNGGLWSAPIAGIRLCDAWQRASTRASHHTMALGAMHCAWHAFTSRWLALGDPWSEPKPSSGADYTAAFGANDVATARSCAITLARSARQQQQWASLLQPLLEEDLGGGRLRFIAAVLRGQSRQVEWQPWIAGLVSHAMDQRSQHDRTTAARFGRSMLAKKAGAEVPADA